MAGKLHIYIMSLRTGDSAGCGNIFYSTWQEESATSGHPMGIREYTRHSESDWDIDSDKQKMATHTRNQSLLNLNLILMKKTQYKDTAFSIISKFKSPYKLYYNMV